MIGITHVILAIVSAGSGLWAAYLWYRSSIIPIDPAGGQDSGDIQMQDRAWLCATIQVVTETATLNKRAACWTAIAVLLGVAFNCTT